MIVPLEMVHNSELTNSIWPWVWISTSHRHRVDTSSINACFSFDTITRQNSPPWASSQSISTAPPALIAVGSIFRNALSSVAFFLFAAVLSRSRIAAIFSPGFCFGVLVGFGASAAVEPLNACFAFRFAATTTLRLRLRKLACRNCFRYR